MGLSPGCIVFIPIRIAIPMSHLAFFVAAKQFQGCWGREKRFLFSWHREYENLSRDAYFPLHLEAKYNFS